MKTYTDLEQSKKLAGILPLKSADMWWVALNWQKTEYYVEVKQDEFSQPKTAIPCWSLAALLDVLPKFIGDYGKCLCYDFDGYYCGYIGDRNSMLMIEESKADNPVDACYKMILKLHEFERL